MFYLLWLCFKLEALRFHSLNADFRFKVMNYIYSMQREVIKEFEYLKVSNLAVALCFDKTLGFF